MSPDPCPMSHKGDFYGILERSELVDVAIDPASGAWESAGTPPVNGFGSSTFGTSRDSASISILW